MSIDPLLSKQYNRNTYNCAHFVVDAWKHVTGFDISGVLASFLAPVSDRYASNPLRTGFRRLTAPVSPCIVLMRRPRQAPHVGVYYGNRVLHMHEQGVEYQPIDVASRGFTQIRFYQCLQ